MIEALFPYDTPYFLRITRRYTPEDRLENPKPKIYFRPKVFAVEV
jgi:hypothetical protein